MALRWDRHREPAMCPDPVRLCRIEGRKAERINALPGISDNR